MIVVNPKGMHEALSSILVISGDGTKKEAEVMGTEGAGPTAYLLLNILFFKF